MNLISLEQRRNIQLLKSLFVRSKDDKYLKKHVRVLRGNVKLQLKLMSRCSTKYINSPLYRGTVLWDKLLGDEQRSRTIDIFTKSLYKRNSEYLDLIGLNN